MAVCYRPSTLDVRTAVVVLGDLGRSPRMQYHARALAVNGADVDLVGYAGASLPRWLLDHPRIAVHRVAESRWRFHAPRRLAYAPLALADGVRLFAGLLAALLRMPAPDVVLVQTPPALPALAAVRAAARWRRARLAVDWHNLAGPLLSDRGAPGWLARQAMRAERAAARAADVNLCVSRAMADRVARLARRPAAVLYDRPAADFAPLPAADRDRARGRLLESLGVAPPAAIVVSPTSWSPDEATDLVLDAADDLETRIARWEAGGPARRFPAVLLLLTGDGEGRKAFERRRAARLERRVHVRTVWFPPDEYPRALAAADLGLSLHRSASGLDLPMKIADCWGAGLPVAALDAGPGLAERVRDGENAVLFTTAGQLAGTLVDWFHAYPELPPDLEVLTAGARRCAWPTWEAGWDAEAKAMLMGTSTPRGADG